MLAALIGLIGAVCWQDGVPSNDSGVMGALPPRVAAPQFLAAQPVSVGTLPDTQAFAGIAASAESIRKRLVLTSPPVQLLIPSIDVHRPVEHVGANRFGVMDLPANAWNPGWWKGGPVPGSLGDAVIEGHAGYPDRPGLFGRLANLRPGDQIIVVLADGSRRLFLVVSSAILPIGAAPAGMGQPDGPARLTLFTCAGKFDKNSDTYANRLVVEANYAGLA
jgi:hypothetical protein